jgi:hypothetical protein
MPPPNDPPDRTTSAISELTDRVIAYRVLRGKVDMDRLSEKLAQAAGVVGRATAKLEEKADLLIAREEEIDKRSEEVFSPHHAILDSAGKGLDAVESKLALLSNDPLESSGHSPEVEPAPSATFQGE